MKTKQSLFILFSMLTSIIVLGQDKIQYITIDSELCFSGNCSFTYSILGLDDNMKTQITPLISKNYKTENELFNDFGQLGWEVYLIEDLPNKISQSKDDYGRVIQGEYYLYRSSYGKRKIYMKIKIRQE